MGKKKKTKKKEQKKLLNEISFSKSYQTSFTRSARNIASSTRTNIKMNG